MAISAGRATAKSARLAISEARDGERSFGRHHSNSFTTPDTKRTKGQGPGLVNVLLAATHSNSFTTCGQRGQGAGMVHVLLPPAQRLVHDLRIKGPGARTGGRSFAANRANALSRRKAEVVNGLLGWRPKELSPSLVPGP